MFNNARALTIENLFRLSIGLLSSILFSRFLSNEDFGKYNYILSFVLIFLPFFSFGTDDILIKKIIEKKQQTGQLLKEALKLRITTSTIGICIIVVLFFFIGKDFYKNIDVLLAMTLLSSARSFDLFRTPFQAATNEAKVVPFRIVIFLILAALKIFTAYYYQNWKIIVALSGLEILFFSLSQFIQYRLNFNFSNIPKIKHSLFKESFPLFLALFAALAFSKVDQLMIPHFLSYTELSYYSVSAKLIELWIFVPNIIIITLYPKLISSSKEVLRKRSRQVYALVLWTAIILIIGVFIVKKPLISLLYGDKYLPTIDIITPYAFSAIFQFFNLARTKVLITLNKQHLSVILIVIGIILNLIFNSILIPKLGLIGAVYGTIAAHLCSNLIMMLFSKTIRLTLADLVISVVTPWRYIN